MALLEGTATVRGIEKVSGSSWARPAERQEI